MNENIYCNYRITDIITLKRESETQITTNCKDLCVISCRVKGKSVFFCTNQTYTANIGDVLYIPYNSSYRQKTVEDEEVICIHIEIYGNPLKDISVYSGHYAEEICNLFNEIQKIWREQKENYYYNCLSLLYKIIGLTGAGLPLQTNKIDGVIEDSVKYLNANLYNSELTLSDIHKKSLVSRTYFNKVFKSIYNDTPVGYVNKHRIEKAKMLLKSGIYTREEVSTLCGFSDIKYFYTVFKKLTGYTIGEFLKS